MGRFDFHSGGAAISGALAQILQERQILARQQMLDEVAKRNTESQMADRVAGRDLQAQGLQGEAESRAMQQQQIDQQGQQHASDQGLKVANTLPAGAPVTPEIEAALGPLAGSLVKAEGGGVVPPEVGEGPQDQTKTFVGNRDAQEFDKHESLQRELSQKMEEHKNRAEEIALAVAEGRMGDAAARIKLQEESLEIRRWATSLLEDAAKGKAATKQKEVDTAADAVKRSRAEIRDVAMSIRDNPHLTRVIGPWTGALKSFHTNPESVKLDSEINRLHAMLSFEGRLKLKGSGAVSDQEDKKLDQSGTSMNQRTNPEIFKQELDRIINAANGDRAGDGIFPDLPQTSVAPGTKVSLPTAPTKPSAADYIKKYGRPK